MTFVSKPRVHHPNLPTNELGLTRRDYEGSVSTLCAGCGHDSVSAAIVQACAELSFAATPLCEGVRYWLFIENAKLFLESQSRFQLRARSYAQRGDRSQSRQSGPDVHWCLR